MTFTVALIGRPNVGKSTLYNRLTGTRHALVDDTPGVTRDRREGVGNLGPLTFRVFDTAGLEEAEKGSLTDRMTQQTLQALQDADVAVMLVDGRAGITPMDRHFAQLLRQSNRPCVLAVNKAEGQAGAEAAAEAYALGLGEAVAISAEHNEGMVELYARLAVFDTPGGDADERPRRRRKAKKEAAEEEGEKENADTVLSIAIIGRPNAGKSTLVNRLLGEERLLTGPEAGITRDAIAVDFSYKGRALKLVDTAGIRKKANVQGKLEKLSVADSLRAIRFAQVAVLMMDATNALEKQDLQLADLVEKEGRALVLAVNKWDLVPANMREKYVRAVEERMDEALTQVKGVPVVPIAAESGNGLEALMRAVFAMHATWNRRIPTGELNRWLEEMLSRHAPPLIDGRRLKIRYVTQAKTRPPSFTLFCNLSDIPAHYLRYLVGGLRGTFDLKGVPVRLRVKKNKNPYEERNER